jgi:CARDB
VALRSGGAGAKIGRLWGPGGARIPGAVHNHRVLAFLDGEEQVVAPQEPERPKRRAGGPERRRQQYLVRRLIGVGVGIAFLILLVIGFRGCLEARSDRGLHNYAQDVGTIMSESEARGKDFFDAVQDTSITPIDLRNKVAGLRGASEQLLTRAQNIGTPGQMKDAQSATILSLRLRRDALDSIYNSVTTAAGDTETADSVGMITDAMGELYASDVLWGQVAKPEISDVLTKEGVSSPDLPDGNFMPLDPATKTRFLDQTEIASLFSGVSGTGSATGDHGLGLVSTSIGGTTLNPDTTNTVPDNAKEVAVQVENQGTADESSIGLTVTVDGNPFETTIESIAAGATETAKITLNPLPQPGSEVTVSVVIDPVNGESVTENNQSTYNVVFGTGTTG